MDSPAYIETVAGKGYRFIAPVASIENRIEVPVRPQRSRWIFAGIGSIAVLVGAAIWFVAGRRPADALVTPVPLTSYVGQELEPSLSPDGNFVAFTWNGERQDNFDIYVKQIGTERPLRLTTDRAKDFGPAWSPDGRFIAFGRLSGPLKAGIFVIPAIGGPERKLTETLAPHTRKPDPFLAWSPDSKWLVVSEHLDTQQQLIRSPLPESGGPPASLFLCSVETGERRRLTTAPSGSLFDAGPAFSPDGRALALSAGRLTISHRSV